MSVYEKLQQVQIKLKVPKNQVNKFGGYNYRSCEDILEAVKPVLAEVGATLIVGDELVQIGDRYYIKATAKFIDLEDNSEVSNSAWAREPESKKGNDESQVTGSTSSYSRKYALNGLFCLDDVKDADAQGTANNKTRSRKITESDDSIDLEVVTKITPAMVKSIEDKITAYTDRGVKKETLLKTYHVKSLDEMNIGQYRDCMDKFTLYEKEDLKNE